MVDDSVYEALDVIFDGLVDPREVVSKAMPEQSALHVGRTLSLAIGRNRSLRKVERGVKRTLNAPITPKRKMVHEQELNARKATNKIAAAKGKKMFKQVAFGTGVAGSVAVGYKAGSKKKEQVVKSMTWNADIVEIDEDKRQVFGYATVTHVNGEEVIDRQGDYIPLEEIEKAAYNYVLTSRKGGDMHDRDGDQPRHTADLIESVIISPEKAKAMGIETDRYGWWLGMRVNEEEQWADVKSRARTGFSIHGMGRRADVE